MGDEATKARRREREAYAALNSLRATLDTLPRDHPCTAELAGLVAVAEEYWRRLRAAVKALEHGRIEIDT